jgi:hypothetical protein
MYMNTVIYYLSLVFNGNIQNINMSVIHSLDHGHLRIQHNIKPHNIPEPYAFVVCGDRCHIM